MPHPMRRNSSDEATIRAAVRAYAKHYGKKQGVALAAEAIGMGERTARHALGGHPPSRRTPCAPLAQTRHGFASWRRSWQSCAVKWMQ
jgi:hypothetical protein